jgi:hypothetical protein
MRWRGEPQISKLESRFAPAFERAIAGFSQDVEHFVLDFHCPKCHAPYAIGFEEVEIHMATYAYRPLHIWGLADKPNHNEWQNET